MKRYIPVYVAASILWAWLAVLAWPQAKEVWRYMHSGPEGNCEREQNGSRRLSD